MPENNLIEKISFTGTMFFADVAGVFINNLESTEGLYFYQIISALHSTIKEYVKEKCNEDQKYKNIHILSASMGAIIIIPDSPAMNSLELIMGIAESITLLGIPVRIGISHGLIEELEDVDKSNNFIGKPINVAARVTTAKENEGILVEKEFASKWENQIDSAHWLSSKNRQEIVIRGKPHDPIFDCYKVPSLTWKPCPDFEWHSNETSDKTWDNTSIITYDLPGFSACDPGRLRKRFRSLVDTLNKLLSNRSFANNSRFYFLPGGDGGVIALPNIHVSEVYPIAKELTKHLEEENEFKDLAISVSCRIGVHYGVMALYENAEGISRPTGSDILIAEKLTSGDEVREEGEFLIIISSKLEDVVTGGNTNRFQKQFKVLPSINVCNKETKRYVDLEKPPRP